MSSDVLYEVHEDMKLLLHDDAVGVDGCPDVEKVANIYLEVLLVHISQKEWSCGP